MQSSEERDVRYMMDDWGYTRAEALRALEDGAQADVGIERMEARLYTLAGDD